MFVKRRVLIIVQNLPVPFDRRVWLELHGAKVEIDLERVIAATDGESDAVVQHAVQRLCAGLRHEVGPPLSWQAARTDQVFNFGNVLSKFLMVGMPLDRVIACATSNAAKTIPAFKDLGVLRVGSPRSQASTSADRPASKSRLSRSFMLVTPPLRCRVRSTPASCAFARPRALLEGRPCFDIAATSSRNPNRGARRFTSATQSGLLCELVPPCHGPRV